MKGNDKYAKYTPDVNDPKKFSKNFLLLLIAYIDPNLYRELYSINKKQLQDRIYNKWGHYQIDIYRDLANDIETFVLTNNQSSSRSGFRRTKNEVPTGTFYKFKNIDEKNKIIERDSKIMKQEIIIFKIN